MIRSIYWQLERYTGIGSWIGWAWPCCKGGRIFGWAWPLEGERFKQMLLGPSGTTLPHFSIIFVHHTYVITNFHSLASPMLMHAMPIQSLRHHGDTISPRTGYHYSAILAMINREYLSTDHYSIMTDAETVTFRMRLSLADKADLLVQLVRRRRELTLSWFFFPTWRFAKFIN